MNQDEMFSAISEEDLSVLFDDVETLMAPVQEETREKKTPAPRNWKKGDFLSKRRKR